MPAQRSRAPDHARHVVPITRQRSAGWWLLLVAVVCLVLAAALLIRDPPSVAPGPAGAPIIETPRVTVELGEDGNIAAGAIEFRTDEPVLHLTVAERTGLTGGFTPDVDQLRVLVDGSPVDAASSLGVGELATIDLPDGAGTVLVEFVSTGTFRPTTPSAPGRGLALLTPLTVQEAAGNPATVEVVDSRVLNLGCVQGDVMTACGEQSGERWVARDVVAEADVIAQLDLG